MAPELVIFDCDGVLVDTEPVSNRVMAEVICEAGVAMSVEEVTEAFAGMRLDDIALAVEERLGKRLPEGWVISFEERRAGEFRKGVEAIAGVAEALRAIDAAGVRTCVASQASLEKMKLTLGLSGLIAHFDENSLFSSCMVERGKPYPDLFLLAAREMGVRPADCVVVEDGVLGARAGRRAGMDVLGYAPDGKDEGLKPTFVSMARLPTLLVAGDGAPHGQPRRNVELKARDRDPAQSLALCEALGADDQGELIQRDTYFNVPTGRLKLREEKGGASHLISYLRADELGERLSRYRITQIDDAGGLEAALSESLGRRVVVSKRRRLFIWRDVRIHLDRVDGLGSFLEIEAVAPDRSDLADERQKVRHLREAFAIRSDDLINCSYSDLILEAG
jgi:predicted adenylyl cyclase CyaB